MAAPNPKNSQNSQNSKITPEQTVKLLESLQTRLAKYIVKCGGFGKDISDVAQRYLTFLENIERDYELMIRINVSPAFIAEISDGNVMLAEMATFMDKSKELSEELRVMSDLLELAYRPQNKTQHDALRKRITKTNYELDRYTTDLARLIEDLSNRIERMIQAGVLPISDQQYQVGLHQYTMLWRAVLEPSSVSRIWKSGRLDRERPSVTQVSPVYTRYFDVRRDKYRISREDLAELRALRAMIVS